MRKIILFFLVLFLSANSFALKILIVENKSKQEITASGGFIVVDTAKNKKYKIKDGGKFNVQNLAGARIKAGSVESGQNIIIRPSKKTVFTLNGNGYTGSLIIIPGKTTFNIVEDTTMENYLYGVLPYEMSASWPLEALKAQAVAARTYTARSIESPVNKNFDLYSDVRSQMYKGSAKVYDSVKEAVDDTKHKVLKHNDKLFYTYYHANCGGHTSPLPWGGEANKIKPLSGAKCGACGGSKSATWARTFTSAEIQKFTQKKGLKGTVTAVSVAKKHPEGRATLLTFKTKDGKKNLSCHDFRMAMGSTKFKSCHIASVKKTNKGFTFNGRGYGHGTGMCQDGAKGLAEKGADYKKILKTFYPGAQLTKI